MKNSKLKIENRFAPSDAHFSFFIFHFSFFGMSLFKKKPDPISDRAQALTGEIAALEAQIRQFETQLKNQPPAPRLRPAALPQGQAPARPPEPSAPPAHDPVFVKVEQNRLDTHGEAANTASHYNELGVRKYDLPALLRRLKNLFRGPSASNPRLVNYLAAGGVQGLRPLRYEKRVARLRFFVLTGIILLVLFGSVFMLVWHR
jgi:hypothetical protein